MRDKVGQTYLAIGGVIAGAGISTLFAGTTTNFDGWAVGLVVGIGIITAVGLYMLIGSLVDWWLPGRSSSVAIVVDTAQELSGEIYRWLGDRRRAESEYMPRADSWDEDTRRMMRHGSDTMARWNELYAVKALVSYDRLIALGATVPDEGRSSRFLFEHPTNPLGIEEIGRTLGVLAAQIEMKRIIRS